MKISISQLRRIIKEEVSRVSRVIAEVGSRPLPENTDEDLIDMTVPGTDVNDDPNAAKPSQVLKSGENYHGLIVRYVATPNRVDAFLLGHSSLSGWLKGVSKEGSERSYPFILASASGSNTHDDALKKLCSAAEAAKDRYTGPTVSLIDTFLGNC